MLDGVQQWDSERYATAAIDVDGADASVSLLHCRDCGAFVAQPDRHDEYHLAGQASRPGWLRAEMERARQRSEGVPERARPKLHQPTSFAAAVSGEAEKP